MSSDLASYQSFRSEYKFPFEIAGTDTEKKEKLVKDIEGPCIYIGTPWMLYLQSQKPPILTKTKFLREALKRIFAINVNDGRSTSSFGKTSHGQDGARPKRLQLHGPDGRRVHRSLDMWVPIYQLYVSVFCKSDLARCSHQSITR